MKESVRASAPMPSVSAVVVSDFEAGAKTWKDEIAIVDALCRQDLGVPVTVIVVEGAAQADHPLPPVLSARRHVRVVYHDADTSSAMKDYGVSLCETEWVAVLEADAVPERDWLRRLFDAATAHPECDFVTGRTHYGTESSWSRSLNLLDRSFDDRGRSGPTRHISNNGALCRTAVLQRFPYPEAATPFLSSQLRNERILAAGHQVYFERLALMRHALGGWDFVVEFRRHSGFADLLAGAPSGLLGVPWHLCRRAADELERMWRLGGDYCRWYDWPLVLLLFAIVRIPETMGMVAALRAGRLSDSAYR